MSFARIAGRVRKGAPLAQADGLALFAHPDLMEVGSLANEARERRHGDRAYFNRNLHINPTNVCVSACRLCSFSRRRATDAGAFVLGVDEAVGKLRACLAAGQRPSEVHVVGGLHAGLPFDYFTSLVAGLKTTAPDITVKAFSAVEIFFFHRLYGMSIEEVLRRLMAAGLGALPGGGAEILSPRVRRLICPNKCGADEWLEVHRAAHRLGLPSNATMLYGTVETLGERVEHLLRLRELQSETGGFLAFVPLPFHPENTALAELPAPTAAESLRVLAVSRLLLPNVPHIKAYWVSLGLATAQTALWFGADDLDGTISEEKIYHQAGARTPEGLSADEIVRLIRAAGRVPVERDTFYALARPAAAKEAP
ncbi:MAG: aminofutalosine synthase MqnE [Deltaproteobacteria bacterium]|nr:aminofutalosine synthase MqnE [Deltaproteobacteria bacterium]